VFSEFSALAAAHGAVNLGQGFPDFDGPDEVREAAVRALRDGVNQYAVGMGAETLRKAIAEHSARFYGMEVDPRTMITVTSGATEAIFDSLVALVDPGDEVVLFEPFYDSYAAAVAMAGGTPRFVLLRPPDDAHSLWWFDEDELGAAFGEKTKVIVVNTPHNPTGKVFTIAELSLIAALCEEHDVVALADEVYEHIAFAPAAHVRLATLPGMRRRTVTVSSGGKSFGFTGWKIGWAIAEPPLRDAVQAAHQFVTFASAAPLQAAIAVALRLPDGYFEGFATSYRDKRDRLGRALAGAGLRTLPCEGTYFLMADIRAQGFEDDFAFCRHLTREVGVAAIPPSAFYGPEHRAHGRSLARFAFCKRDETLERAAERLNRALSPKGKGSDSN
jgi:N-succinyldiaminopimelate aminotransferase